MRQTPRRANIKSEGAPARADTSATAEIILTKFKRTETQFGKMESQ